MTDRTSIQWHRATPVWRVKFADGRTIVLAAPTYDDARHTAWSLGEMVSIAEPRPDGTMRERFALTPTEYRSLL